MCNSVARTVAAEIIPSLCMYAVYSILSMLVFYGGN